MSAPFLSHWFRGFDRSLEKLDERSLDTLMTHCGQACSDSYTKQIYIEAYGASDTLDAFIERLNGKFGEMAMRRTGADTVEVVYTRCACDLVRNGYVTNPKLCLCSLKSLQYNWEAVLGEGGVECSLEESILGGNDRCRFLVKIVAE
ncbi:MAG: hypothetical protein JW811_02655 [Clostridiales bacterium]|nr:hypothetical protein [Clostridiales bacterium]